MTGARGRAPRRRGNQLIALAMIAAVAMASYLAFHPSLPWHHGYELKAVFTSSNQLKPNSPVRIAGVDVGKVTKVGPGPGDTSTVTMEIEKRGRPLHRDATLRIRPRVFLEGGFYVELEPGSPSAPTIDSNATIPLPQTTTPVQFHQLLTAFDRPTREGMKSTVATLAEGLSGGGADGLRQAAPHLAPAFRDLAWVARAGRGEAPHDVSELISAGSKVTGALASDPDTLADMVSNLGTTARALRSRDTDLAASVSELDGLLRVTPPALRALDRTMPVLDRVTDEIRPALPHAAPALRQASHVLDQVGALVKPGTRERTVDALGTTFRDLPQLIVNLSSLFPTTKPLADCLRTHIVPALNAKVPDGALSTNDPVWLDFAHSLVGLTSATQNFDGNGYATRYLFGLGSQAVSTDTIPGVGKLVGRASTTLQSRPAPLESGPPPLNPTAKCADQTMPKLETPVRDGGFRSAK